MTGPRERRDRAVLMGVRGERERGQAAIEYAGVLTLLLIVALAALQLGVVAYTAQQAGTAARAAARAAALPDADAGQAQEAGLASMSGWLRDGASVGVPGCGEQVTATVSVEVPALIPLFDFGTAERSVTMPCD
ncbi:TadE/TadG family type IV pilus assembly protein [Streptomyces sp. NPDC000594]|uniref:TadE/TadG family type IV pilus assembly protein n=1 Tax=Streptomyces sp. NPDC000594 TaxID=3154261 RepID=UPI0033171C66